MRIFAARDAARKFGALLQAAADGPVGIAWHGSPRFVVVPLALYEAFVAVSRAHFERRVLVSVGDALARFDAGDVEAGVRILRQGNAWARRVLDLRL